MVGQISLPSASFASPANADSGRGVRGRGGAQVRMGGESGPESRVGWRTGRSDSTRTLGDPG